jgi:undecaprenyl-diphosphatase
MEHYLKILILALIQGAAELLPVSSSAHVIVAERLMGLDPSTPEMVFLLVMLHTGTMFAVLVYFWPRWRGIWLSAAAQGEGTSSRHHFLKMVILATAITGLVGAALYVLIEKVVLRRLLGRPQAKLEDLFKYLPLVAASLFVVGIFIIVAGLRSRKERPLTGWSAIWIGLLQGVCLPFRGLSRSGATISLALLLGIPRQRAEDFSFALAIGVTPAVIGYSIYKLLKEGNWPGSASLFELFLPGLVGMVFSFLAGLAALKFLSAVLEKGRWKYFGYYCVIAAALMAAGIASGVLSAPPRPASEITSTRPLESGPVLGSDHPLRASPR